MSPEPTAEPTAFLYPFIEGEEKDVGALLEDLAESARRKINASLDLRSNTFGRQRAAIRAVAAAMAERFALGGRMLTFGNGGSAADADATAAMFRHPPSGLALPARSLVADHSVLTALGNDVGFELIFARQMIAHAHPADIAMGISTSGGSANVLAGFAEASRRGALTVGIAGYDGGAMLSSGDVAHCLVVESDSVHRIQETQDALARELWFEVQEALAGTAR